MYESQRIIVYGSTLEAYHSLSVLESSGRAAQGVRHIAPEGSAVGVTRCMMEAAEKSNVILPVHEPGVLVEIEEMEGGQEILCIFEVSEECTEVSVRG